ncbi:MAG: cell wall hydrolase [Bacillota bacterium]
MLQAKRVWELLGTKKVTVLTKTISLGLALTVALGSLIVVGAAVEAATHRAVRGDSLWRLGRAYGTTVDAIKAANGLSSDVIRVGQVLAIPEATARAAATTPADSKSVALLARMIAAEAEAEPYRGMVAVGAVIMNRVRSSRFPNTIWSVLFQKGQFEPVSNGHFWRVNVQEIHRRAAREALAGVDPTGGALFFFAPSKTSNRFMWSRPAILDIGNHRFTR